MENLFNHLEQVVLRMDSRFCTEDGHLLKNNVIEAALALDPKLLHYLLADEKLKKQFFSEVDGLLVFDKVKFQRFVMNKQFLPDSYTAFKNKVGLTTDSGEFLSESREVVLSWPYKDCMLEGGQTKEDAKRQEIFWNETLAPDEINRLTEPKALCHFRRYDSKGEHEATELRPDDNLIIKGNNLLALYSLRERFRNSVKLIYIDPPYNTGNDSFGYNDSFNHSTWLTFMKNRLEVAKELLKNGGMIFIECDKNEAAYLKVLCDMVFGIENFVNDITVQTSYANGLKVSQKEKTILKMKDTILVYKKGEININPQYAEKPYWDTHYNLLIVEEKGERKLLPLKDELVKLKIIDAKETITRQTITNPKFFAYVCANKDYICCLNPIHASKDVMEVAAQSMGKIVRYESSRGNEQYFYNGRQIGFFNQCFHNVDGEEKLSVLLGDIWTDIDFGNTQNEGGVDFPAGKKAEMLIRRILSMTTNEGDLVLDFFGGSGTTAAVAHKMNRRYISCEQLDTQISMIQKRLQLVVNGEQSGCSKSVGWQPQNPGLLDGDKYAHNSFVYCELAQANQQLVEEIMAATEPFKLQEMWERLQEKGFLSYKVSPKMFDEGAETFKDLSLDDQKRFLIECLDKNMLYIPFADIDDEAFTLTKNDKLLTRQFYARR